jgi:hypothetical protein
MLIREAIKRIKSYHAVIASAKETIGDIIACSEQRTLKERIEKAYQWHIEHGVKIEKNAMAEGSKL